jgi:aspartate/methionine/tyrosine aminotransferase
MSLIDSPENPIGDQFEGGNPASDVWDGVYNSKIYTKYPNKQPKHKYFVGSYSKLLGVAGARIGFIATNDPLAYESLLHQSHNELTGISIPSQDLIVDILKWVDLEEFMSNSSRYLCYNKEEFQKIEYLFDGQSINETGMFYSPKADAKAIALLDKVGVNFVRLDDETIRLSMGQHKDIVKKGINAILKGDRK